MAIIANQYTQNTIDAVNLMIKESALLSSLNVPIITDDASMRSVGMMIMGSVVTKNEFATQLINRIALVKATSKSYKNKFAGFKKGMLPTGETIEEVFIAIAEPMLYNAETAEDEVFKRVLPEIHAVFHILNAQIMYKGTSQDKSLSLAFNSVQAMSEFIVGIIDSLYNASEQDEFLIIKYLICKTMLDSWFYPVYIPTVEKANMDTIVATIKEKIEDLGVSYVTEYNPYKVPTISQPQDLHLIQTNAFKAKSDVMVLASAFNMEKVEYLANQITIGNYSFTPWEQSRLAKIFENDPNYAPFTTAELAKLASVPCAMVDNDFFVVYDKLLEGDSLRNPQNMATNYWLHKWSIFSASPFANAILFTTIQPSITSVTLSPETATVAKGAKLEMTASVVLVGFAPNGVKFEIVESNTKSAISPQGLLVVASDEPNAHLTIKATSIYDSTKSDTSTITIS